MLLVVELQLDLVADLVDEELSQDDAHQLEREGREGKEERKGVGMGEERKGEMEEKGRRRGKKQGWKLGRGKGKRKGGEEEEGEKSKRKGKTEQE